MMRRMALLPMLVLLLLASPLLGQDLRIAPAFVPGKPDHVEVLVENLRGSAQARTPIRTQDASSLTLVEDGSPTVTATGMKNFRSTERGMAIVIAVDVSGTMAAGLPAMKRALHAFVRECNAHDRVALITFADDVRVDAPFDRGLAEVERAIDRIAPRGKITELYKALFKGLELLDTPKLPERRRMVILTDGKDEGVGYTLEDVLNKAKQIGFPVDATGVSQIDPKYLSVCERLADLTGGIYSHAKEPIDLERLLRQEALTLQSSPVVVFVPKAISTDGKTHRIGVQFKVEGGTLGGEKQLLLPPPSEEGWRRWLNDPWVLAGGGGGLLLVVALLFWWRGRRRKARREAEAAIAAIAAMPDQLDPHMAGNPLYGGQDSQRFPTQAEGDSATLAEGSTANRTPRRTVFQSEFRCDPPRPGHPAVLLKAETGPVQGRTYSVETDPCWIGAEVEATISIPQDDFLSGFHAYLRFQGGMLYLFDEHSSNGTFKNEIRLTGSSVTIAPGDRIKTGRTVFLVVSP